MIRKKFLIILCCVLVFIKFTSCTFQVQTASKQMEVEDISVDTTYYDIVTQGYMGGSLIYNGQDNTLGQLVDGVTVAVRLSKAEKKIIDEDNAVFKELEKSAVYGLLIINSINIDSISFSAKLYDVNGIVFSERTFSLNKNEKADLNNDGLYDIAYVNPVIKRTGYEKSAYLKFISSQDDLNITMFAVLKEQYPEKTYPNGIIGVNTDERFIIQKYVNEKTGQRTVLRGIYKNDYIVDNVNNRYQKVLNNNYARSCRAIDDIDLETMEEEISDDAGLFYFTEEDFVFTSTDSFLTVLPSSLLEKYGNYNGIEKLNRILEDKNLLEIIDEEQGSILPECEKKEIFNHIDFLTLDEIVQLNRVFLEKNYPSECPQRISVSSVITEILPLVSVVFVKEDDSVSAIEDFENSNLDKVDSARRITGSFTGAATKADYNRKLSSMRRDFDSYKQVYTNDKLVIPVSKKQKDYEGVSAKLNLNKGKISVGIKGSFSSTWGSVKSSLGAAAFFEAEADINVDIVRTVGNDLLVEEDEDDDDLSVRKVSDTNFTIPIVKKKINLYEFELYDSTNIATFAIGPVIVGINLDLGVGLPIKMDLEMDCDIAYAAYIAAIAKAGVSVGLDYGVKWKKKWFVKIPVPYVGHTGTGDASADAIYFFEQDFDKLDGNLNKLGIQFSVEPYVKAALGVSIEAIVHADISTYFSVKGYTNIGYYNPCIKASYGVNLISKITANTFIGLKKVKVLGIKIDDIGKKWGKTLFEKTIPVIKETPLYSYKIN